MSGGGLGGNREIRHTCNTLIKKIGKKEEGRKKEKGRENKKKYLIGWNCIVNLIWCLGTG